jgi:SAM-dependent methyltransferase
MLPLRLLLSVDEIDASGRSLRDGCISDSRVRAARPSVHRAAAVPWSEMPRLRPISSDSRDELRATFESIADRYHQARPQYPAALFDALIGLAELRPGDRLLEVGCGTGKATIPLAQRGFPITCAELGAELAAVARRNLMGYEDVTVHVGSFESWPPVGAQPLFHLVFAATAWHWIDPEIGYRRAWELLRPGGHLAFWSATHVLPDGGDPFFTDIQGVYEEIGEALPADALWHRPGELPDDSAAIRDSGLFDAIQVRQFDWELTYDADSYISLLDTFSGHITMHPWQRQRLYGEIRRRLSQRADGRLHRHWGAVLHVARAVRR